MEKESVTIKVPTTVTCNDYHEFYAIQYYYDALGLKVKVEEIGVGEHGLYIGIVYLKKNQAYKKLLKACMKECET